MSTTLPNLSAYQTADFLSEENFKLADETVGEVFNMMLGLSPQLAENALRTGSGNHRTAIVGFSGAMRGSCEVRMDSLSARTVTSAMVGDPLVDDNDPSVGDAVGEICNMIAGGWKNRIPSLSSLCQLSPPTIISGCDYYVKLGTAAVKFARTYSFDGHTMEVTLQCEELRNG